MALVLDLAHLAGGQDPVADTEIDDLDHWCLAAGDRAQARFEPFARHQRHQLRPDGVGARASARTADDRGRIERRRGRRGARHRWGLVGRARARDAEAEQRHRGQTGAARDPFTHQATISERQPLERDVAGPARLE